MSDLISRQAAIDAIDEYIEKNRRPDFIGNMVWVSGVADAMRIVRDLPSVQERKKGRWIKENIVLTSNPPQYQWHCSECGRVRHWFTSEVLTEYCPHCGAKMEGAEDAGRDE